MSDTAHRNDLGDPSYSAYSRGCRCAECRELKRVYVADRRAAGLEVDLRPRHDTCYRPRPPYDPQPAVDHLLRLHRLGWTIKAIAAAAGVDSSTITRAHQGHLSRRAGDAILNVIPVRHLRKGRARRRCRECHAEFETQASSPDRYCGRACRDLARAGRPHRPVRTHTDEQIQAALRSAATNGTTTVNGYQRWRDRHPAAPSERLITLRYGSWNVACALAGVACGPRPPNHDPHFTLDQLEVAARAAVADGVRTVLDYNTWAREHPGAPSSSLLRARLGTWSSIVTYARRPVPTGATA